MEYPVGLLTVFAVSGSVALVALQAHKHLLSDFMKKVELQLGTNNAGVGRIANACSSHSQIQSRTHSILKKYEGPTPKVQEKKKVRFADDVVERAIVE